MTASNGVESLGAGRVVRVAAVGDLHMTAARVGRFRPGLLRLRGRADVLLLAGDLTEHGLPEQAACVAAEVCDLGLPVLAVLGSHDHLAACGQAVAETLISGGVRVLEGDGVVLRVGGLRLGVAGTIGSGGGFDPTELGGSVDGFEAVLDGVDCDVRVALTHYASTVDTVDGEPPRLYPKLGSAALGAAIDAGGAHLAVHGHAHRGQEVGTTGGGVEVRNVAHPVIRREAGVYRMRLLADGRVNIEGADSSSARVAAWVRWASGRSADLAGRVMRRATSVLASGAGESERRV